MTSDLGSDAEASISASIELGIVQKNIMQGNIMKNQTPSSTTAPFAQPRLLPRIALGLGLILTLIFFASQVAVSHAINGKWKGTLLSSIPRQTPDTTYDFQAYGTCKIAAHPLGSSIELRRAYMCFGPYIVWKSGSVNIVGKGQRSILPTICHYDKVGNRLVLTDFGGSEKAILTRVL